MNSEFMRLFPFAPKLLVVALAYFVAGRLGLALPYGDSHITLIWLPTGIAVAALFRWGNFCWPGIFIGALATNYSIDSSPLLDTSIALGNTLGPLLTVWLLRRQKFHAVLDRVYDTLLLVLAAAIGMLVSATGGILNLILFKVLPMQEAGSAWLSWWAGDFMGVLLAAPLLINVYRTELKILWTQRVEYLIWFLATFAIYGWMFFGGNQLNYSHQFSFVGIPTVVWAAMRFGTMGTSLGVLLSVFFVAFATEQGVGPFNTQDTQQGLIQLWTYFFTLVLVELIVVAMQAGRKQAEIALQTSERNLKQAQATAHLGSWDYDMSTGKLLWSDELYRIYGVSPDKFTPSVETLLNLIHPDDQFAMNTWMEACASGQNPKALEFRCVWPDGSIHDVEGQGNLLVDVEGKARHISGTGQDITKRKLAEIAIRDSEARFRAIIEATPIPLALNDEQGNITYLNKAFITTIGYTPEDIPTLNDWWPRAYPDLQYRQWVADNWQNNLDEAKRTNSTLSAMELNVSCKNGEVRAFLVSAVALQGTFSGTHLVILFDISERKRAEVNQLIAATAFESQESLMITDVNGVILRVNKAFTQSTGYTAEEVVGKTPNLLKSGRHDAEFYRAMWESINSTGAWQGEIWDRRKNGEIYPKWLSISAVKGDDGAVTHYIGSHLDVTERKDAEEKIQHLAFHDHLTDLPNRLLLLDRLQQAFVSVARSGHSGALLFIDLDNFKNLNDTLGHDMGDMLLQHVAQRLRTCIRVGDTISRLGGDEFVVMLLDLSEHTIEAAAQAESIGEKILTALSLSYQLNNHTYRCTGSIGATLFSGNQQATEDLMKQADIAMYQAKKAGRNTLRFFDLEMQENISARVSLEVEMQNALEFKQFHLHYQIQVDSSHRPLGAEALIRWIHPMRGQVSPEQFIPLAEENGLILPICLWVLETACAQLKAWQQDAHTRELVLAVNVSAKQFHQADFVTQVQGAIHRHDIKPMLLKLELTEGIMLEDINATIATMSALNELGVLLSLDDFGTGYSSLQYLKQLPLDQLKIDQSFVRDISTDSSDKAIVSTIIAMAQILNLDVIAEGVETEEQRQFLLDSGCSNSQGFLCGRPVPIEQFEASLKLS